MFHRLLLLVFFFSPSFLSQVQSTIVQENFQSFDEELINIGATEENDIGQESKQNEVPLYHHVGCFLDKPSRALPYSGSNFNSGTPAERINNCAVLSAHRGHDTFGVQLGGQCFTGNDARYTYRLYGQGDGCKDGLGGVMRNDVYFLGLTEQKTKRTLSKGIASRKKRFCCGKAQYDPQTQQCCLNGQVVPQNYSCTPCRETFFDETKFICCNGAFLRQRKHGENTRCCGAQRVYNKKTQICCGGQVFSNKLHGCCGRKTFIYKTHQCCEKRIILKSSPCNRCSGTKYNPSKYICCGNTKLFPRRYGRYARCCGNDKVFDNRKSICCTHGQVRVLHSKPRGSRIKCCLTKTYKSKSHKCCKGRKIVPKSYTCEACAGRYYDPRKMLCCSHGQTQFLKPKKFLSSTRCCRTKIYNSKSHKCCKGRKIVPKSFTCEACAGLYYDPKKTLCCSHGQTKVLRPKKFRSSTSCCRTTIFNSRSQKCCRARAIVPQRFTCSTCAGRHYNPKKTLCCSHGQTQVLQRKKFALATRCCLTKIYNSKSHQCCRGTKIVPKSFTCVACAGRFYNPTKSLCCSYGHAQVLHSKKFRSNTRCCRTRIYNILSHKCCRAGTIVPKRITCSTCAGRHYDPWKTICCSHGQTQVLQRRKFGLNTRCCRTNIYNRKLRTCCHGKIHKSKTYGQFTKCCGNNIYDSRARKCCSDRVVVLKEISCIPCALRKYYNPTKEICCNGMLFQRIHGKSSACCGRKLYNTLSQRCCDGKKLFPKSSSCPPLLCGRHPYDADSRICCNERVILPRLFGNNTMCCVHNTSVSVYHRILQKCCLGKPITTFEACLPNGNQCTEDLDVARYLCCSNRKVAKPYGDNSDCCGEYVYDRAHELCCDGVPSPIVGGEDSKCCGRESYNEHISQCCAGNIVVPKCGTCPIFPSL